MMTSLAHRASCALAFVFAFGLLSSAEAAPRKSVTPSPDAPSIEGFA